MNLNRILWPTNFSPAAAESYVVSLSQTYRAEVHLLHVAEDLTRFENYWGSGLDTKHLRGLQEYILRTARERLAELCRDRLTGCPRYQVHIIPGDPAEEILKVVKEIGADLIVMATHGMRANFPFGSVTEKVVKNSPVPVLTVSPLIQKKS